MFADSLARFHRLGRDEFGLDDAHYERLTRAVRQWRDKALGLGRTAERERDRDGPDLGAGR